MEQTNYYAVRREPLEEIRAKLLKAKLTAMIADGALHSVDHNWVVVESPRTLGCKVPGDFSTFSVLFDPWNILKIAFPAIVEIFIEENQKDWSIKCWWEGLEKSFKFYENLDTVIPSEEDSKYLSALFNTSFEQLSPLLTPDKVSDFCNLVRLPYFEMEMQDKLQDVIPEGSVIFRLFSLEGG